jgi:DNA-binding IclR family transcriptional regulator
MVKLNKVDEQVLAALKAGGELGLQELTEKTGEPSKKVFRSLRKLFENELITTKARKYSLCANPKPAAAGDEEDVEAPE